MGHTHALSGAVGWLAGCDLYRAAGGHPTWSATTVGAVVCAGWALAPDLDHPSSTIARCGGPVTRGVAVLLAALSAWVHRVTKTRWDREDLDGHRTLLHTLPWALACGGVGEAAGWVYGRWAAAVLVAAAAGLAGSTLLSRRLRRTGVGVAGPLALGVWAYWSDPGGSWWLGLATGAGCVIHCLGDCLTNSGCPILWPIPIPDRLRNTVLIENALGDPVRVPIRRRWRRWYLVGTPRMLRFGTGDTTEAAVAWALGVTLAGVTLWWLWPAVTGLAGRVSPLLGAG